MARVERDAEERVTQPTFDDLVQRAARLADMERPVPLGDGLEVRRDEPLDVVADRRRQLGGARDDEPGAAVECAPDPEGDGEAVAHARSAGHSG